MSLVSRVFFFFLVVVLDLAEDSPERGAKVPFLVVKNVKVHRFISQLRQVASNGRKVVLVCVSITARVNYRGVVLRVPRSRAPNARSSSEHLQVFPTTLPASRSLMDEKM